MRTGCDYSMSVMFEMLQVHLQPQSLTKEINLEDMHRRIYDKLHIQYTDEQLNKHETNDASYCQCSVMLRKAPFTFSRFPDTGVRC